MSILRQNPEPIETSRHTAGTWIDNLNCCPRTQDLIDEGEPTSRDKIVSIFQAIRLTREAGEIDERIACRAGDRRNHEPTVWVSRIGAGEELLEIRKAIAIRISIRISQRV